jgi:hypothetical protein
VKFRALAVSLCVAICAVPHAHAERQLDGNWTVLPAMPAAVTAAQPWVRPDTFAALELNEVALRATLLQAPLEDTPAAAVGALVLSLPGPDGTLARFDIVESPVMEPGLAARYPQIKTYLGRGIDDRSAALRMDMTPQGFHAQVLSPKGAWYIDPYTRGDTTHYASYYKRDLRNAHGFECFTPSEPIVGPAGGGFLDEEPRSGDQRRTFRLACAATGEYVAYHSGVATPSVTAGMAAIVTAVNRVSGVYELELCVRLVLINGNDQIVYTNPSTDPYTNSSGSTMLSQNQANLDAVIGAGNYDIGHVFSTGGGGIANLRSVCVGGSKARGVTGLGAPTGDPFYIDYVAHEMGHQFGGNHTFNGPGCGTGGRVASAAYEPGSGTTIMGYAGVCGSDNIQWHSDPYFHGYSYSEIRGFINSGSGGTCGTLVVTGNNPPSVNAGSSYTVPRNTPFALTAGGSDPDGDTVTYCWEQWNLGAALALSGGDNGSSPIMRSFQGTTSPTRTIPRLSNLLANTFASGEILASTTRTLSFRVTARDNRAGSGGVTSALTNVSVSSAAGPFQVTSPNSAVTWSGQQTVTWDVAGTDLAPISTSSVAILLSTDGGNTFPITLLASTPNTGSAVVTLPNMAASLCRIKVAALSNIYFDVSNASFLITPGAACYANCDQSTQLPVLNVGDFTCFLQRFAAADSWANCDQSVQAPVLNVGDFTCFLQRFAAGCP